jgi:hypothetical protein
MYVVIAVAFIPTAHGRASVMKFVSMETVSATISVARSSVILFSG